MQLNQSPQGRAHLRALLEQCRAIHTRLVSVAESSTTSAVLTELRNALGSARELVNQVETELHRPRELRVEPLPSWIVSTELRAFDELQTSRIELAIELRRLQRRLEVRHG